MAKTKVIWEVTKQQKYDHLPVPRHAARQGFYSTEAKARARVQELLSGEAREIGIPMCGFTHFTSSRAKYNYCITWHSVD